MKYVGTSRVATENLSHSYAYTQCMHTTTLTHTCMHAHTRTHAHNTCRRLEPRALCGRSVRCHVCVKAVQCMHARIHAYHANPSRTYQPLGYLECGEVWGLGGYVWGLLGVGLGPGFFFKPLSPCAVTRLCATLTLVCLLLQLTITLVCLLIDASLS